MPNKIAFLFLTLDNPNFPNVWNEYFKNNEEKINIYIHPKYPEKVTWKPECIIDKLVPTEWGFIVSAYKQLFKYAFDDDKKNKKFITLSESCLPIKPFNKLYKDLMKDVDQSLIKLLPITKFDYEIRINEIIKKKINRNLIKHYARMCLTRNNIKELFKNKSKLKLFEEIHVGDEFFLSSIYPINNFKDLAIIHDDWEYVNKQIKIMKNEIRKLYEEQEQNKNIDNTKLILELKKKKDKRANNPKNIIIVSNEDLDNMTKTKSYFYRKFDKLSDIEKYIYSFIKN